MSAARLTLLALLGGAPVQVAAVCPSLLGGLHVIQSSGACEAGSPSGASCVLECDDSSERVGGDAYRDCQSNDLWSGADLACALYCPDLPGNVTADAQVGSGTCASAYDGSGACDLACRSGHRAQSGDASRTCGSGGSWSGAALVCEPNPTCPR